MVWFKNGIENLKMDKPSCSNDDYHDEGGQGQTDYSSGGVRNRLHETPPPTSV